MATEAAKLAAGSPALLSVRNLRKQYWRRAAFWRRGDPIVAVDGVDFEIPAGRTLALVGRSGSGKSTVARCVSRLERTDAGEIWIDGRDISKLGASDFRPYRAQIQMVFQDAATSINPHFSAAEVIAEPLLIQKRGSREYCRERALELMQEVGLSPDGAARRALDFSGGQRQRLAIARALALHPKLLVLDEALSGLDLSTQAQIANLLLELQAARSLTYLLISHDIALVARIAHTIAVMSAGKIVEQGPASAIVSNRSRSETKALLASATAFHSNLSLIFEEHA